MSDPATVIFLHIGKTAGTTLRWIIRNNYDRSHLLLLNSQLPPRMETFDQLAAVSEQERRDAQVVLGHLVFGVHRLLPGPSTYITLLRDPIDLAVSYYRFILRNAQHPYHAQVASAGMSFAGFMRSGIVTEMDNGQTRVLAGDITTPYGSCTPEMLETALHNVEQHIPVVGLTERFDESLLLLRHALGWTKLRYVSSNVARSDPPALSDEERRAIEEHCALDIELYRRLRERFDDETARIPSFERELARFRVANRLSRPFASARRTVRGVTRSSMRRRRASAH